MQSSFFEENIPNIDKVGEASDGRTGPRSTRAEAFEIDTVRQDAMSLRSRLPNCSYALGTAGGMVALNDLGMVSKMKW